jgi:hypothetical protein
MHIHQAGLKKEYWKKTEQQMYWKEYNHKTFSRNKASASTYKAKKNTKNSKTYPVLGKTNTKISTLQVKKDSLVIQTNKIQHKQNKAKPNAKTSSQKGKIRLVSELPTATWCLQNLIKT